MLHIVDLHIHSRYSRATSPQCVLAELYRWGKIKGITIIGTGDFTHPVWFSHMQEYLEPAEQGLYRLKEKFARPIDAALPETVRSTMIRFICTVEISTIYAKNGRVRKLHNLVVMPSMESASRLNTSLYQIGNLKSDGRPILGLDSKELLRLSLEANDRALFIPAHIWTPWFSLFGSKSGFDTLEEAFEELTPQIYAIETGLSSDPFMNWRLKQLQPLTILSNSDAHSPQKLGREATVMDFPDTKLSYDEIVSAVKTNDARIVGTIEFFPEEGKYHFDGHRACSVRMAPPDSHKHKGICPRCGKSMTLGVDYRVGELADYPEDYRPETHKKVEYIIPLIEILTQLHGVKTVTRSVRAEYERVYSTLGNEFSVLRTAPLEQIAQAGFSNLAHAIGRMRSGKVFVEPGYDGVFGIISVYKDAADQATFVRI